MSKLMIAMPSDKTPPLYDFFNDELNEKQRQKLLSLFALMLQAPVSVMREPYVKHFTLERYSTLYELRCQVKNPGPHHLYHDARWRCALFDPICQAAPARYYAGFGVLTEPAGPNA